MAIEALIAHHGGVAIFYRKAEHFAIKELRLHGPNIFSFQLLKGRWRWYFGGCYITPSDTLTIDDVTAAIRDQTYVAKLLVAGNLNADLVEPEVTPQCEAILYELAAAGLMYMGLHFLPRRNPLLQDRCMWSMWRDGQEVRSRMDNILGKYCRLLQDLAIRDPRHHLDHYIVLGCLRG